MSSETRDTAPGQNAESGQTRETAPGGENATSGENVAPGQTRDTAPGQNAESGQTRDTIYIGKKPLMAYVTAAMLQLPHSPVINIKARGMCIGRAVDVAQIISRKTENLGYSIGEIRIDSVSLESTDGRPRNVSTIEIEVKRNSP